MLKIVFTCNWEIRNTGNGIQKSIMSYRKIEKIGIREGRGVTKGRADWGKE